MDSIKERGKRLLPVTLDNMALTQPNKPWISVPLDDSDISKGFTDITFKQFSNAINHATSWLESVMGNVGAFDTFAYEGPADARLAIIAVAAAKVGWKVLLPFPYAPSQVKGYLLDITKCKAFVYASHSTSIQSILDERPHIRGIVAPSLQEWITEKPAIPYVFKKSWDEAADDPWIIFHTSGTTGFPKPIVYTHRMMTTFDAAALLPDANQDTQASHHVEKRVYSTIPMNHLVGMVCVLQGSVWLGSTIVLGPASSPASPPVADQVIQYGRVEGFVAPPILIRALSSQANTIAHLRSLRFIQWAGAPLDQATGNLLKGHVKLSPAFGSTEAGPYLTLLCEDPDDWAYYRFRAGQGIVFEQRSDKFWELVFRRQKDAHWQQIFLLYPELDEYPTKDLFEKHPSKDELWLYVGRSDDMVVLSNGNGLHASSVEAIMLQEPKIEAALIGGEGRDSPFLLVRPSDDILSLEKGREAILSVIWPAIEAANASVSDLAKIKKELIVISKTEKPFLHSGKGSLLRRENFSLYSEEIEAVYDALK